MTEDTKEIIARHPGVERVELIAPEPVEPIPEDDLMAAIDESLCRPVGSAPLTERVRAGMKVVFLVSDRTRMFPKNEMIEAALHRICPPVEPSLITFIVAGGNHDPHGPEQAHIKPELASAYRWLSHDSKDRSNLAYAGRTRPRLGGFLLQYAIEEAGRGLRSLPRDLANIVRDPLAGELHRWNYHLGAGFLGRIAMVAGSSLPTRVYLNRVVLDADLVITIGQVKPHYFTGYSGGAKSILPAVSSFFSIASNHLMRPHPRATLGVVRGNPIRADMEDAARLLGKPFIMNCVLDTQARPYGFFAGDVVAAHREACRAALEVGGVEAERADVVVVRARPPLNRSVYQFSKAIAPAIRVVRPGGVIIGVGECPEGVGKRIIVNEVIFKLGFNPRIPEGVDLMLVSDMPHEEVSTTAFTPLPSIEAGLDHAREKLGRPLTVNLITEAGPLMPYLPGEDPAEWI